MAARVNRFDDRPSTTWVYEPEKMRRSRREGQQNGPKAPRWFHLRRRDPRDALTIRITYRGGSEAWYLIEARGSRGAFSGVTALHDVMQQINEGSSARRTEP